MSSQCVHVSFDYKQILCVHVWEVLAYVSLYGYVAGLRPAWQIV